MVFKEVPEWMCKKFKVLKYVRVASNGALKWFKEGKDIGYVWVQPALREKFGVEEGDFVDRSKYHTISGEYYCKWWVGFGNGSLVLRPNSVRCRRSSVGLHRIVAAAWVPNDDPRRTCVCFKDGDKTNVNADNLVWRSHKEIHDLNNQKIDN